MPKKLTTEEWVARAKSIHGRRYDYSRSKFKRMKDYITIGCKKHGWVEVNAGSHTSTNRKPSGCRDCGYELAGPRIPIEEWVARAKSIHGGRYDYSKSELIGKTRMSVRCIVHGEWHPDRSSHATNGNGCPKCSPTAKVTKEEFLQRSISKYGEKYDYSRIDYVRYDAEISIYCSEHQISFSVTPSNHIHSGSGCWKCSKRPQLNTERWVDKALRANGEKYDYSKVNYVDSHTPVTLICPIHGDFQKIPIIHTHHKTGCPKCMKTYSPSTEEWIERAISIHGERYDYSKVNYTGNIDQVEIICKKHGPFKQTPSSHIHQKAGCSKCSGKWKLDTSEFVKRARLVHDNFYDYSKTKYLDRNSDVVITCPDHSDFTVRAADHLRGVRCRKCAGVFPIDEAEFIRRSKEKFGDLYDFSSLNFKDMKTKVSIFCPIEGHGEFNPNPVNFLHSVRIGCPSCTHHGFQPELPAYYYVNTISMNDEVIYWKGGITNDFQRRFRELRGSLLKHPKFQNCKYSNLHLIKFERGRDAANLESDILSSGSIIRANPVKELHGGTELFVEDPILFAVEDLGVDWLEDLVETYWRK